MRLPITTILVVEDDVAVLAVLAKPFTREHLLALLGAIKGEHLALLRPSLPHETRPRPGPG